MSGVRVLVGTRKGAFVLTSDGKRAEVGGRRAALRRLGDLPREGIAGEPGPACTRRRSSGWFGQIIQRSDDGGKTWAPTGKDFIYDGVPGTHQWYDGTPHPWEFARVWHLEPSPTDVDTVYAGVEDAALFKSTDGGGTWQRAVGPARAQHGRRQWQPGAGGMCLHTIILDPKNAGTDRDGDLVGRGVPQRRRRRRRGGRSTRGCTRTGCPTRTVRSGTACTTSRCIRRGRTCCSCRSTGT